MMQQRGLTLIELMVALAISSFIILGVSTVFATSKRVYQSQEGLSRIQENGRFVTAYLTDDLRLAGFPKGSGPTAIATASDGVASASDSISISYNSPFATIRDCRGIATTNPITNVYTIEVNAGTGISGLVCNGTELVEGVDNLQILYGLDTDNIPDGQADIYLNATNLAARWARVVSIRMGYLINSVQLTKKVPTKASEEFQVLNTKVKGFTDRRQRRPFATTILLRNNI